VITTSAKPTVHTDLDSGATNHFTVSRSSFYRNIIVCVRAENLGKINAQRFTVHMRFVFDLQKLIFLGLTRAHTIKGGGGVIHVGLYEN
jgi:hypothetical protein